MATYQEKLLDPRWQRKRLEVLQRAGFACENCGATDKTLHVHHGYYERNLEPWEYPDETLWSLCVECHEQAEQARADVYLELGRMNQCLFSPVMILNLQSLAECERMARINPLLAFRLSEEWRA